MLHAIETRLHADDCNPREQQRRRHLPLDSRPKEATIAVRRRRLADSLAVTAAASPNDAALAEAAAAAETAAVAEAAAAAAGSGAGAAPPQSGG
jgi:hypothetical protein